jgi:hypothetical protein
MEQEDREKTAEIFWESRRFEMITKDESLKRKLVALIVIKKLSREDLILILSTIRLNPSISSQNY